MPYVGIWKLGSYMLIADCKDVLPTSYVSQKLEYMDGIWTS
jgi:hypothetical protein